VTCMSVEMRATADTLEALAEGDVPADPFDLARLAVQLRDWALQVDLERAAATNVTVLHPRNRFPGER
jgi:hypothetical protein